ncbi:MAG TPA: cytochrome c1 [Usitatibacter sp.]|nr:cytochrome c1 [Usitatibacter sp.]
MKKILAVIAWLPMLAWAATGHVQLERAPVNLHDKVSLQRGAHVFVNHCLNCHSASVMRYTRLTDLGLDEAQIRGNLLLSGEKVGEPMTASMDPAVAKAAFGVVPPDLSLVGRSRGADWLYTYMRSFYRDPATKTGWNNMIFPNVAMPHVLWEYQGDQALQVTERMDSNTGDIKQTRRLVLERPGAMAPAEYDRQVADLVNYLTYMGEPAQADRKQWGILVLFFMAGFFVLALMLKNEYWKDVR